MALVCALSNEVPEVPVLSPVSGCIFERRLAEKYIEESGSKDPINGEPLTKEMLIEIKVPQFVKAKPPTSTSIPGLLKSLQDEWDAIMLQSFTTRQQLQTARQELSHAMYQHDAACRVIARLTKENSSAKEALAALKPRHTPLATVTPTAHIPPSVTSATTELKQEIIGVNEEVLQHLTETASALTAERKRKSKIVPANLTSQETIKSFTVTASHAGLHSASTPGILCLDMQGNTVITGGNDRTVAVFNTNTKEIVGVLKGHAKKVMNVVCHPTENIVLSGSIDSTIRIWQLSTMESSHVIRVHEEAITGLSLHATGDYIISSSMDRHWAFSNLHTGAVLSKVVGDETALTSAKFHPDGLICATGTLGSIVKIWDLKQQENVANFSGHNGPVTSVAFSENGYYLATAGEDGMVKLWDLRKLKNFKTIELGLDFTISDLDFDNSGTYLALIGNDLRVYNTKTWNEVAAFNEHTNIGTGVRFGGNAAFLATTSMDRTLKFFGTPEP